MLDSVLDLVLGEMRETERNFGWSSTGICKVSIVSGGESTGLSLESMT